MGRKWKGKDTLITPNWFKKVGKMRKSNVSCAIYWILLRRRLLEKRIIFERNNYHRNPGIDWRPWKLARIHLFSKRIIVMEMMNRNHSKYWTVNHWNRSTLVIIVSVILKMNLNWKIYQSCNIYLLIHLEVSHSISITKRKQLSCDNNLDCSTNKSQINQTIVSPISVASSPLIFTPIL